MIRLCRLAMNTIGNEWFSFYGLTDSDVNKNEGLVKWSYKEIHRPG